MLTAVLDTSLSCALAIADGDRILFNSTLQSNSREHDRQLPPWLLQVLDAVHAAPADIRRWTVGTGPGSFAGLRSGIALIKGICAATGAQLRGVPSAIATAAQAHPPKGETVGVIMDGRCGQVLFAAVRDGRLVDVPAALQPEDLLHDGFHCDAWITPQPMLLPPLPEAVQSRLLVAQDFDPSPLLFDTSVPWPDSPQETDKSCEPLYVRPPVFVQPVELKNLLA